MRSGIGNKYSFPSPPGVRRAALAVIALGFVLLAALALRLCRAPADPRPAAAADSALDRTQARAEARAADGLARADSLRAETDRLAAQNARLAAELDALHRAHAARLATLPAQLDALTLDSLGSVAGDAFRRRAAR